MTQQSFDFIPPVNEATQEIQKWVEQHNKQVIASSQATQFGPGSLLSALDTHEAKANAIYLLRTALSQCLRKSMIPGIVPFKRSYLQAIRGEIAIKKSTQDPALAVRNILIKIHSVR